MSSHDIWPICRLFLSPPTDYIVCDNWLIIKVWGMQDNIHTVLTQSRIVHESPKATRNFLRKQYPDSGRNDLGAKFCFSDVPSKNSKRQRRIKILKFLARGGDISTREEIRLSWEGSLVLRSDQVVRQILIECQRKRLPFPPLDQVVWFLSFPLGPLPGFPELLGLQEFLDDLARWHFPANT